MKILLLSVFYLILKFRLFLKRITEVKAIIDKNN